MKPYEATQLMKQIEDVVKEQVTSPAKQNQITLSDHDIDAISQTMGGKLIKTSVDVVKLFKDNFRVSVNGAEVQLDLEDMNALKDQFGSTSYIDYNKYIGDSIKEALSLYLWGSTKGILQY